MLLSFLICLMLYPFRHTEQSHPNASLPVLLKPFLSCNNNIPLVLCVPSEFHYVHSICVLILTPPCWFRDFSYLHRNIFTQCPFPNVSGLSPCSCLVSLITCHFLQYRWFSIGYVSAWVLDPHWRAPLDHLDAAGTMPCPRIFLKPRKAACNPSGLQKTTLRCL